MNDPFDAQRPMERALERLKPVSPPDALRQRVLSNLSTSIETSPSSRLFLLAWFDRISLATMATVCLLMFVVNCATLWTLDRQMARMLSEPDETLRARQFARQLEPTMEEASIAHVQNYVERLLCRTSTDRSIQCLRTYEKLREMEATFAQGEKWHVEKILKVAFALLTVLMLVVVFRIWRVYARVEQEIAELKAKQYPTHLVDLKREVPARENAAVYLAGVAKDADGLYARIHPFAHSDPDHFDWSLGLNEKQIAETAAGWDAFPQVLESLEKASQCQDFAWPMNFEQPTDQFINHDLMDVANSVRTFARILDCRARYLVSIKKPDEAAEAYLQLLRLCRLQNKQPTLVLYLVNNACRHIALSYLGPLMQHQALTPHTFEQIETELALHQSMAGLVEALKSEIPIGLGMSSTFPILGRLTMGMDQYLRYLQEEIEIGVEDDYKYGKRKTPSTEGFASLLAPAVGAAREATSRTRAMISCLRILNALKAQGIQAGSNVDRSQLQLPQEVMVDPFNGQPLVIRSTDQRWAVYSVGKNGQPVGFQ